MFRFGVKMNKQGFMMPTVLAFIIITSSALLYQSVSTVSQLYSLKAEIHDLSKLEYAVNTNRVVDELEFEDECSYNQELEYQVADNQMMIASNCIYTNTENEEYNKVINKLLKGAEISQSDYTLINDYIKKTKTTIEQASHETTLGKFDQQLKLMTVNYHLSEPNINILIVAENGNVINNISVK